MRGTICWLLIVASLCGCGPLTVQPSDPDNKPQPTIEERAPASEIWLTLSHAIDAGRVTSTNELAQLVIVLARNGDLSTSDIAGFDAAFPNSTKTDRELTKDDSVKLRGIK